MTWQIHPAMCLVKLAPPMPRPSGILEAPDSEPVPAVGRVVQTGRKVAEVQPGDYVLLSPDVGEPWPHTTVPHLLVRESELLGVLEHP